MCFHGLHRGCAPMPLGASWLVPRTAAVCYGSKSSTIVQLVFADRHQHSPALPARDRTPRLPSLRAFSFSPSTTSLLPTLRTTTSPARHARLFASIRVYCAHGSGGDPAQPTNATRGLKLGSLHACVNACVRAAAHRTNDLPLIVLRCLMVDSGLARLSTWRSDDVRARIRVWRYAFEHLRW